MYHMLASDHVAGYVLYPYLAGLSQRGSNHMVPGQNSKHPFDGGKNIKYLIPLESINSWTLASDLVN